MKALKADTATVIDGAFGKRPEPPAGLTERQAEIWRDIVAGEPPGFFKTATLCGILADLCRHRSSAEQISAVVDSFKPDWLRSEEGAKRYYALLKMRDLETAAVLRTATKLRLTNQSRYVQGSPPVSVTTWS